jgi:hypothetical protein
LTLLFEGVFLTEFFFGQLGHMLKIKGSEWFQSRFVTGKGHMVPVVLEVLERIIIVSINGKPIVRSILSIGRWNSGSFLCCSIGYLRLSIPS